MTYLKDTPKFEAVNKVLIIKLRHLGDVVLSSCVISVLKTRFPHLMIDVLVNEEAKDLLKGLPEVHEVLTYNRKGTKNGLVSKIKIELDLAKKVRKGNYDLVINLTEGDKGNILALLSKAKYKVGQMGSKAEKRLTHLYKHPPFPRHNVEKDLDALRRLGIYPQEHEKKLLIAKSEEALIAVDAILKDKNIKDFIILHPVSRWMYKSPRPELFIEAILKLNKKVLITGMKQGLEGEFIEKILKGAPSALYFDTNGSLSTLIALLERSSGIITVDSLPLHIASSLKKPTVCLFGPTNEIDWGPWQNELSKVVTYSKPCRACYKDGCGGGKLSECLEEIKASSIISALQEVLQEV